MESDEITGAVIDVLESLSVPYMLAGSFSTNFYGIPRSTQDADFVVRLAEHSVLAIMQRLGPSYRLDPQMSFELVTATRRHVIQNADDPFQIELFLLSDDPHDQERFRRRIRVRAWGRTVSLPTVEDVIITKLRWSQGGRRTKDLEDVRNVIAVQSQRIDWPYVEKWCDEHGTRQRLDDMRRSLPDLQQ